MPKPTCVQCSTNDSLLWRNQESGQICNECYLANTVRDEAKAERSEEDTREDEDGRHEEPARATGRGTRKSTRATRYKPRVEPAPGARTPGTGTVKTPGGGPGTRGRGRRSATKRTPLRAPTATATVVSSDYLYYKGIYMQVGDIVSMVNVDGGIYYAQIRGFLTDQYCEKSAVVTWLLPTRTSPAPDKCFDPATYIIGPEEELPRKLEYMTWVMHAPTNYYRAGAHLPEEEQAGFIWTSMEPRERT